MKRWQFWVGLGISLALLYLALRNLHLEKVLEVMKNANYIWLLPGIGVYFIGVWVRAWRWHYLLKPLKKIQTKKMYPVVTIGFMGNNIYPARAGELLLAVVLKRWEGVPISATLATIIIERIFDGVVLLGFVALNLPSLAKLSTEAGFVANVQNVAVWGSAVFIGALLVFLLAAMYPRITERITLSIIQRLIPKRWREKVSGLALRFLSGLASLRSPVAALMIFFTSTTLWLIETGMYWFVMQAFPFRLSFFALMLMNGFVNLATIIPSAPGYIGTFDALGIAILKAFQVNGEIAAGYTLVLHVALWLPVTLVGAYFFLKRGLKWSEVVREENAEGGSAQEYKPEAGGVG